MRSLPGLNILILLLLSGCASTPPFEWNNTQLLECAKGKTGINSASHCRIDTITPNSRTGFCGSMASGWAYRLNKYLIGGTYGTAIVPRPARSLSCRQYHRRNLFVEGEYIVADELTVLGDICHETPTVIIHRPQELTPPQRKHYLLSREWPLYQDIFRELDPRYDIYVARYTDGNRTLNSLHTNLNFLPQLIEKQCGTPPQSMNIYGRVVPKQSDIGRIINRHYDWEEIYSGKMVQNGDGYELIHDNVELAKDYKELANAIYHSKIERHNQAVEKRYRKKERAQEGLRLLFEFGAISHGIDCENSDDVELVKRYCEAREDLKR